ncbi:unnamed protein product [Leptidea sinapis]|uniref:Carbohydrate sulfotransferase n=1 Tax=Leptidea sinapis TaxID=189913 RepID=A0A5E4R3W3_9NEOP|nr:unnamed protein product [Leptidea sinapis]
MRASHESFLLLLSVLFYVSANENSFGGEHSLELTQSLNLARQEHIQETCARLPVNWTVDDLPPNQLEHILIDDKHKLLYCYVPKRTLMILTGKWNNNTDVLSIPAGLAHSPGMFRNLSSVSKEERDIMLENYHKMIIVRNPFERLLSAYRNKLAGQYETLLDDALLALHTISASHIHFPRLAHTSGTAEKLRNYFAQLELPLIRRLYKLYKYDYKLFSYDLDNIVGFDLG